MCTGRGFLRLRRQNNFRMEGEESAMQRSDRGVNPGEDGFGVWWENAVVCLLPVLSGHMEAACTLQEVKFTPLRTSEARLSVIDSLTPW